MTLLNGGQRGGNSPTKLRVLGAARKSEVKATQNLSIIVAFFAVCWMPLYTINCVQAFCDDCPVPESLLHGCIILSHLNSAGNPLLYAYHLKDFRNAFRSLLLCKKSPRHRNIAQSRSGCTTVAAAVTGGGGGGIGTGVNGADSSISSSLTCSGGSSRSTVIDCWRRSVKYFRSAAAADTASRAGDARSIAKPDPREIVAIVIDPSAPVLLSVRQLVE
uniref:Adenosine receptor A2a n=2 Tax=Melanaphis sacchari TaxID=742174 RepID=A0A2H8TV23_9HEMI